MPQTKICLKKAPSATSNNGEFTTEIRYIQNNTDEKRK